MSKDKEMVNMINYLAPSKYRDYNPYLSPGRGNPGGGVATKVYRVNEAANLRWLTSIVSDLSKVDAPVVLVEPLWFCMPGKLFRHKIEAFKKLDAMKIFYGTELSPLKWPATLRSEILGACDAITVCCDYQREMFRYIGVDSALTLCDPVPSTIFGDTTTRRKRLVAAGKIGWQKNSETVADLFEEVEAVSHGDLQTVYLGGADMWGDVPSPINTQLQCRLEAVSTEFILNAPMDVVAREMNEAIFFAHCGYHDTNPALQLESSMAGCITVALPHPTMAGRSEYVVFPNVEAMAAAMAEMSLEEIEEGSKKAREWALANCSYETFLGQLEQVIQCTRRTR